MGKTFWRSVDDSADGIVLEGIPDEPAYSGQVDNLAGGRKWNPHCRYTGKQIKGINLRHLDDLITIPDGRFSYMPFVAYVNLPPNLRRIEQEAFSGCNRLKRIDLPHSVEYIGPWSFYLCASLEEIVLPTGVSVISPGTFCQCITLTSVRLWEGLKVISEDAFSSCVELQSLIIPQSVVEIGRSAFSRCGRLGLIRLPLGLREIRAYTFWDCYGLTRLLLPLSIQTIQDKAFPGCHPKALFVESAEQISFASHFDIKPARVVVVKGSDVSAGVTDWELYEMASLYFSFLVE
uniref:Leucine rich repeat protein n=1 Tax=Coptotermes formosanus TaxID=36987 RepID=R4UNG2_COPFO|nr:leucine rich repeat protein [Coptotermes formosanus]